MALLRVTVNDIGFIVAQPLGILPFIVRKIDRSGNVAFAIIFFFADVNDDEIIFAGFDPFVELNRPSGESELLFEVCPGLLR